MKDGELKVRNTPIFKLKDKAGRRFQAINLEKQFGFVPEVIIIEKVQGQNNKIFVRAVLTKDQIKKEESQTITKKKTIASK